MERAERAALYIFIAGVGVAMLAAAGPLAFPDAPKLVWQVIFGVGALFVICPVIFLGYEYRQISRPQRMIPLVGIIVSGLCFVVFVGWFFWPNSSDAHRSSGQNERSNTNAGNVVEETQRIKALVDALVRNQNALNESETTKNILGRILAQNNQLQYAIGINEQMTGVKNDKERLEAAQKIISELEVILRNVTPRDTPQGQILIIKTENNTFRVTFAVPMRVPPTLTFYNIPTGSTANVIEKSKLGFTVVFSPMTISVEHFEFSASAEL